MTAQHKIDYTLDEMEVKYNAITVLYELSEELLATVESPFVTDANAQMDIVEPLISEIADAADVLAEEFIHVAESRSDNPIKVNKARVENAMRKVFNALNDYQLRVKAGSKKASSALKNIADPIVAKIERQIEEVVVIFMEFVQLTLAAIMHKQQLEAIRVRDPRIALMMHQHALSQQ